MILQHYVKFTSFNKVAVYEPLLVKLSLGHKSALTAFPQVKRGSSLVWLLRKPSREQSFFPDCDLVQPGHQEVTDSRHRGDGQFLTRSHRTALTEQNGPVPRVITTPFYIVDIRPRLITSGDAPGGLCDDDSFVCYGEFCQTPMVLGTGFEPVLQE